MQIRLSIASGKLLSEPRGYWQIISMHLRDVKLPDPVLVKALCILFCCLAYTGSKTSYWYTHKRLNCPLFQKELLGGKPTSLKPVL